MGPVFANPLVRRVCRMPVSLYGLGIPPAQYRELAAAADGDLPALLQARLEHLACDFDLEDNYFAWQAFGRGYDREHRRALRRRAQRRTHRPRPLLHLRRLPPLLPSGVSAMDAARQMDRMYRYQRHIYDLTSKYYLLGRDRLIATLDPEAHLGLADPLDGVWFSYALSMIPDWRPAVDQALAITHPSGRIHAVDFGDLDGLPPWFRRLLTAWLARFGVHRKPAIAAYFRELAGRGYGQVEIQPLYRGYAELIHFEKI